ncbi:MAG: O-antigen ligase family protein [Lachnospiraceae bacterium]|nr:O-antigen ligase family protein [Lachnospiraceae bacterium]
MKTKASKSKFQLFALTMLIYPFLGGIFYDWAVFLSLVINTAFLLAYSAKKGKLNIFLDIKGVAGLIILASSFLSIFAAQSKGDAVLGLSRIITVLTFVVLLMQLEVEDRQAAFKMIPYSGIIMIAISAIIFLFPDIRSFAFETDRLAGLFQYANTLALFLLFGVIIAIRELKNYFLCGGLILGILWTGSRTTLVLTLILLLYYAIRLKEMRKVLLCILGGIVLVAAVAGLILGLSDNFGRITTLALSSSTFVGRLLYIRDALPVIAAHPLGLGHLGYMMIQPVIQTGVYSVRYIHNEYLQVILDYGWIAGAALIALLVGGLKGVVDKKKSLEAEIIVCSMVHILMDFDFQYLVILYIVLMCMDWKCGKSLSASLLPVRIASICIILPSVWLLAAFSMKDINPQLAAGIYPWSYELTESLTMTSKDANEVESGAGRMLEMNPYSFEAYNALGDVAIYKNDIDSLMDMKWKCLEIGAFHDIFYTEFRDILDFAIQTGQNDIVSKAKTYYNKLDGLIEDTKKRTSPLAKQIRDQMSFYSKEEEKKWKE